MRQKLSYLFYCNGFFLSNCTKRKKNGILFFAELINTFGRYLKKHNGLCWVNALIWRTILATDYKFVEFILSSNQVMDKGKIYSLLTNWLGMGLLTVPGTF